LEEILRSSQTWGGERFSQAAVGLLLNYYQLTLKWNDRLHLTTLTQPQAFFERHILESVFAESLLLPEVNQVWDIGSGLGIPGVVIAILRRNLDVHLVEASRKKTVFLEEVADDLQLANVRVVRSRFESLEKLPANSCLTVRAMERMKKRMREILRLGENAAQILIFGSQHLEEEAERFFAGQRQVRSRLIPGSDRRWIIDISCST
jgi:16S rRNA (guanine(527)-N(7))-methyltransferase RsmG